MLNSLCYYKALDKGKYEAVPAWGGETVQVGLSFGRMLMFTESRNYTGAP